MKIVILDAKTLGKDVNLEVFEKYGKVTVFKNTEKDETKSRVKNADIVIANKVVINKKIIDSAKDLKLICVAATGMNNIDLEYAKKKNIEVKNVAGYSTSSVVQHTFSLAFYLIGRLNYYDSYVKGKNWIKSDIFTHLKKPFWEIHGKKWGIVGLGTIGKEVAKIAKSFGCEVLYYSTSGKNRSDKFKRVTLDKLLKECDIISIHAPLNEKTYNLIAKKELGLMKKGTILLNLGRGSIINEKDLAKTIDQKEIYAGIDVLEREPMSKDSPFTKVKNKQRLFITPHIAWASKEARARLIQGIKDNIDKFLRLSH